MASDKDFGVLQKVSSNLLAQRQAFFGCHGAFGFCHRVGLWQLFGDGRKTDQAGDKAKGEAVAWGLLLVATDGRSLGSRRRAEDRGRARARQGARRIVIRAAGWNLLSIGKRG